MDVRNQFLIKKSLQPNFQGMYVLRGVAKDVESATFLINEKCGEKFNRLFFPNRPYFPGFYEMNHLNLQTFYSDNQQNFKRLIATNEHVPNIANWYQNYRPIKKITHTERELSNLTQTEEIMDQYRLNQMLRLIQRVREEQSEKKAIYRQAKKQKKLNNPEPMADLLIDLHLQAKKTLQQVKKCVVVPIEEIAELDVKTVLEAITKRRFNFITGVIEK